MTIRYLTLVALLTVSIAHADVIVLKTGQKIEGDIIKVTNNKIWVDIGIDAIPIPLDQVESRTESGKKVEQKKEAKGKKEGLFLSAPKDLPVRTVKDLSEKIGEGVVLVLSLIHISEPTRPY